MSLRPNGTSAVKTVGIKYCLVLHDTELNEILIKMTNIIILYCESAYAYQNHYYLRFLGVFYDCYY